MKKLTKKDKILYTIVKMHNEGNNVLRYEDILVNVFKSFPEDFQIRFYPQFPDTDTIRRALYQLIPEGYIRISNRNCALTKEGKEVGNKIINSLEGDSIQIEGRRDLNYNIEIKRLLRAEGFNMYLIGKIDKIIDQDFYEFYRSSVRTRTLELLGKIKQINEVINRYSTENLPQAKNLLAYSSFLQTKFKLIINEESK
ncbi:MAG: hypothetical protein HYZ10_04185 [Ignavibacteriales bacterium]|nr:hypothetical protein [Ignavibacteriales bacterium]